MNNKRKMALKNIVKECLIEILAEGLVGNKQATISESRELRGAMQESYEREPNIKTRTINESNLSQPTQVTKSQHKTHGRKSYLDSMKLGVDAASEKENIKQRVRGITSDPIMSDILADTAITTLREQKESRRSGPSVMAGGDAAAKIVDQSSPEDLFGGQANKWANLAFSPAIRK
jgi:hypothetical protein|tara:strand:+ start:33022 stop:33549 length:528 start_codon:yes stop_codon:yes gene_type:complete